MWAERIQMMAIARREGMRDNGEKRDEMQWDELSCKMRLDKKSEKKEQKLGR